MFLMIRNKGVADYRGLTILGASSSRNNTSKIGMFGSGSKSSILLCLRKSIRPIIYCGNLKMEFYTEPTKIGDNKFNQLCVKYSGKDENGNTKNNTDKLSMSTEWGVFDWNHISMAFREFVSNAIDGAVSYGGTYQDVEFEIVNSPRAKAGHTAIYLPYTPEIEKCYINIGKRFLHYSNPEHLNSVFIPKNNLEDNTRIYKKGVMVCELNTPSLFDYQINSLELDESRNADRWAAKYAIARTIKHHSDENTLSLILRNITKHPKILESSLEASYLRLSNYDDDNNKKKLSAKFQNAFKSVFSEKAVLNTIPQFADFILKKGYTPVQLGNPAWEEILTSYGCQTETKVLDTNTLENRIELEVSDEQKKAMDWAWNLVVSFNMHNDRQFPIIKSFRHLENGNMSVKGYCDIENGIIGLHHDIGGTELKITALHELSHYITGSTDGTRDLEDYLFRLITLIAI